MSFEEVPLVITRLLALPYRMFTCLTSDHGSPRDEGVDMMDESAISNNVGYG